MILLTLIVHTIILPESSTSFYHSYDAMLMQSQAVLRECYAVGWDPFCSRKNFLLPGCFLSLNTLRLVAEAPRWWNSFIRQKMARSTVSGFAGSFDGCCVWFFAWWVGCWAFKYGFSLWVVINRIVSVSFRKSVFQQNTFSRVISTKSEQKLPIYETMNVELRFFPRFNSSGIFCQFYAKMGLR